MKNVRNPDAHAVSAHAPLVKEVPVIPPNNLEAIDIKTVSMLVAQYDNVAYLLGRILFYHLRFQLAPSRLLYHPLCQIHHRRQLQRAR